MANLRKTTKTNALPSDDIESPFSSSIHEDATKTRLIASDKDDAPTAYDCSTPAPLNPFFLHAIRRKVLSLLVDDDDSNNNNNSNNSQSLWEQLISVLRDVILGSIFGLLTISFIIILDHKNIIHLQSAHNFRNAAFRLLHDPETISYMETNMDMKFMSIIEYNSTQAEMNKAAQEMERLQKLLEERSAEGEEKKELLDTLSKEYNTLLSNQILGLDNFCGTCKWGGSGTCDDRVQYLMNTYGNSLLAAKVGAMEQHESCKKS